MSAEPEAKTNGNDAPVAMEDDATVAKKGDAEENSSAKANETPKANGDAASAKKADGDGDAAPMEVDGGDGAAAMDTSDDAAKDAKKDEPKKDEKPKTPEKKKTPVETRDAGGGLKIVDVLNKSGELKSDEEPIASKPPPSKDVWQTAADAESALKNCCKPRVFESAFRLAKHDRISPLVWHEETKNGVTETVVRATVNNEVANAYVKDKSGTLPGWSAPHRVTIRMRDQIYVAATEDDTEYTDVMWSAHVVAVLLKFYRTRGQMASVSSPQDLKEALVKRYTPAPPKAAKAEASKKADAKSKADIKEEKGAKGADKDKKADKEAEEEKAVPLSLVPRDALKALLNKKKKADLLKIIMALVDSEVRVADAVMREVSDVPKPPADVKVEAKEKNVKMEDEDAADAAGAQAPLTNINASRFAAKITYAYLDEVDRRWPKDIKKLAPSSSSSSSSKRPRSPSRNRVSSSTSKSASKSDAKSDSKGSSDKEKDKAKKSEKSVADKESSPPPTKKAKGDKGEAVPTATESESEKKDAKAAKKDDKEKGAESAAKKTESKSAAAAADKKESSTPKKDAAAADKSKSAAKTEEKKAQPEPRKYVKPVFKYDARFMLDCCGCSCHKAAQRLHLDIPECRCELCKGYHRRARTSSPFENAIDEAMEVVEKLLRAGDESFDEMANAHTVMSTVSEAVFAAQFVAKRDYPEHLHIRGRRVLRPVIRSFRQVFLMENLTPEMYEAFSKLLVKWKAAFPKYPHYGDAAEQGWHGEKIKQVLAGDHTAIGDFDEPTVVREARLHKLQAMRRYKELLYYACAVQNRRVIGTALAFLGDVDASLKIAQTEISTSDLSGALTFAQRVERFDTDRTFDFLSERLLKDVDKRRPSKKSWDALEYLAKISARKGMDPTARCSKFEKLARAFSSDPLILLDFAKMMKKQGHAKAALEIGIHQVLRDKSLILDSAWRWITELAISQGQEACSALAARATRVIKYEKSVCKRVLATVQALNKAGFIAEAFRIAAHAVEILLRTFITGQGRSDGRRDYNQRHGGGYGNHGRYPPHHGHGGHGHHGRGYGGGGGGRYGGPPPRIESADKVFMRLTIELASNIKSPPPAASEGADASAAAAASTTMTPTSAATTVGKILDQVAAFKDVPLLFELCEAVATAGFHAVALKHGRRALELQLGVSRRGELGSKIVTWLLTTSLESEKLEVAKQAAEAAPEKDGDAAMTDADKPKVNGDADATAMEVDSGEKAADATAEGETAKAAAPKKAEEKKAEAADAETKESELPLAKMVDFLLATVKRAGAHGQAMLIEIAKFLRELPEPRIKDALRVALAAFSTDYKMTKEIEEQCLSYFDLACEKLQDSEVARQLATTLLRHTPNIDNFTRVSSLYDEESPEWGRVRDELIAEITKQPQKNLAKDEDRFTTHKSAVARVEVLFQEEIPHEQISTFIRQEVDALQKSSVGLALLRGVLESINNMEDEEDKSVLNDMWFAGFHYNIVVLTLKGITPEEQMEFIEYVAKNFSSYNSKVAASFVAALQPIARKAAKNVSLRSFDEFTATMKHALRVFEKASMENEWKALVKFCHDANKVRRRWFGAKFDKWLEENQFTATPILVE